MKLTPQEIEDRLEEAALTLRRLPNPPGSGPRGHGSSWPEYVRDARHAYGYHEARMKVIPNAEEIQRMEDALEWLMLIEGPDAAVDRKIVWMRAAGYRWRPICVMAGCVRSTAWRRWTAAVITITRKLEKKSRRRSEPKRGRKPAPHEPDAPDLLSGKAE